MVRRVIVHTLALFFISMLWLVPGQCRAAEPPYIELDGSNRGVCSIDTLGRGDAIRLRMKPKQSGLIRITVAAEPLMALPNAEIELSGRDQRTAVLLNAKTVVFCEVDTRGTYDVNITGIPKQRRCKIGVDPVEVKTVTLDTENSARVDGKLNQWFKVVPSTPLYCAIDAEPPQESKKSKPKLMVLEPRRPSAGLSWEDAVELRMDEGASYYIFVSNPDLPADEGVYTLTIQPVSTLTYLDAQSKPICWDGVIRKARVTKAYSFGCKSDGTILVTVRTYRGGLRPDISLYKKKAAQGPMKEIKGENPLLCSDLCWRLECSRARKDDSYLLVVRGLENSKGFFQVDLRWARFVDLGGIVLLRIVEGGGDLASVVGRFPLLNFALPTTLEVENMRLEKVGQSYHLVLSLRNTGRDLRSVCIQLKGRELEETPIPKSNLGDINRGGCVVCAFPLLRGNLGGMRFVIEGTTLNDGKVILSKAVTIVRGGSGYELPVTR